MDNLFCKNLALICHGGYISNTNTLIVPPKLKIFQYVEWDELLEAKTVEKIQLWIKEQISNHLMYCEIYNQYTDKLLNNPELERHYLFIVFLSGVVGYIHINAFNTGDNILNTSLSFHPHIRNYDFGLYEFDEHSEDWKTLNNYNNRSKEDFDYLSTEINRIVYEQNNPNSEYYSSPIILHQFTCQGFVDKSLKTISPISNTIVRERYENIKMERFLRQNNIINIVKYNSTQYDTFLGSPMFITDTLVELIDYLNPYEPMDVVQEVSLDDDDMDISLGGKVKQNNLETQPKIENYMKNKHMMKKDNKQKEDNVQKKVNDLIITSKIMTFFDKKHPSKLKKTVNPGKEKDPEEIDMEKLINKYNSLTNGKINVKNILENMEKMKKMKNKKFMSQIGENKKISKKSKKTRKNLTDNSIKTNVKKTSKSFTNKSQ